MGGRFTRDTATQLRAIALQQTHADILRAAVDLTHGLFAEGATFAAVPEGDAMRIAITAGVTDPRFNEMRVAHGYGLGGYVLDHGDAVVVADYPHDGRITHDFVDIVSEGEGLLGIVCVPIIVQGKPQGLLYGGRRRIGAVGDSMAKQLETAAEYAAIGIQQAQERRHAIELERLRDRERLATELHDSVAQMLFGIGMAARKSLVTGDATALEGAMREIEETAAQARRELRSTLTSLAETDEGIGFEARLHGEVQLFSTLSGCKARMARSGTPRRLPDLAEDLVLDVVVEGLRNAVKHAGATVALVYLEYGADRLGVTIQSEVAESHAPTTSMLNGTGHGLTILTDRAHRLGGTLRLIDDEQDLRVLRLELPIRAYTSGAPTPD